ncbi:sensor histidine kinase [Bacillus sp. JJ722]|uniref:sensor histidine kinase n=1 Tax=Bacillus sp. JJ722 TaxID=3122973 RepID=UPI003000B651
MKIRYIYQQLISHISIIVVAFAVLSLMFGQYMENIVYKNKTEELISYGENILNDVSRSYSDGTYVLKNYSNVLEGRQIQYHIFDESREIIYPQGGLITLNDYEWNKIKNGEIYIKNQEYKRFNQGVTFVLLPYFQNDNFIGGILLTSPISGSREMISEINRYLFYTVLIALVVSVLLSWILSKFHVNRIKRIQEATSLVSAGDYSVQLPSSKFDEIGELAEDFNNMVQKLNDSNDEIESLENRRRQFIADVSHELRTPLTTISGVIEGIRNDMIPEVEKEKGINLVSKETKRLIRLVNENLDYEKIRSNQVKLFKEDIQLFEVLDIIKDQLDLLAEDKNNKIIVDVKEDLYVYADYDRLTQIIINITKNSIQFTENGTIWLRGKSEQDEIIIEIEDTGIGMDPVQIKNIWRRFYKADISRTTNPYGEFGLGLSIVQQLVNMHEGRIEVSSNKGQGTKFTIYFPVKQ